MTKAKINKISRLNLINCGYTDLFIYLHDHKKDKDFYKMNKIENILKLLMFKNI